MNKAIGIFGGTFDPVHLGHRYILEAALDAVEFEKLFVIPAKIPPHKSASGMTEPKDRLEMCKLAFSDLPSVEVSDFEINSEGKSYSYYTVKHFRELYPDMPMYFIMGSDQLLCFDTWYKADEILTMTGIISISRDNDISCAELDAKASALRTKGHKIISVNVKPMELSSTFIRDAFKNGDDPSCYLSEKVVNYIKDKKLYGYNQDLSNDKKKLADYKNLIKEKLSKKRAQHSFNVADAAVRLARLYGEDEGKAYIAGLLHDVCKEMPQADQLALVNKCDLDVDDIEKSAPPLFHAVAGAVYVKEILGINDPEIVKAIRYHTVGCGNMDKLSQIIYIADLISEDRDYKDVKKMRKYAEQGLDKAMLEALKFSISDSVGKENTIPACTFECYNSFIKIRKKKED